MDRTEEKIATNEQKIQQQIDWRRSQVLELSSKGYSQLDNARILQVNRYVICRDVIPKAV
jgi:hypothetical protein